MGGAISLCYAMRLATADRGEPARLSGLILSGPLAALEAASEPVRVMAKVLSALTPKLPVFAVDATLVSRDPTVVKAYVDDPLVHHRKLPARTVAELAAAIESFPAGVGAITVPVLIMYGTADGLVPPEGSVMLEARIGSTTRRSRPTRASTTRSSTSPSRIACSTKMCSWLEARVPVVA